MAFTDITSTASVRAVLGVSEMEIRDEVLLDPIYSVRLSEELLKLDVDLVSTFAIAAASNSPTGAQQRLIEITQTFSAYIIARECLGSVAMFAPMAIKDSKSELQRSQDPYKDLRGSVLASLGFLRRRLLMAYSAVNTAVPAPLEVARIYSSAAGLGTDPVTG